MNEINILVVKGFSFFILAQFFCWGNAKFPNVASSRYGILGTTANFVTTFEINPTKIEEPINNGLDINH